MLEHPASAPLRPPSSRARRISAGVLAVTIGAVIGLGSFTFGYGKGWSYLSNDPTACANCHAMQSSLDSWEKSSHHHVAVCNDCHLPHDPIGKWVVKADNGFFHSLAFTLDDYPDAIRIKPRNHRVANHACRHCHADFLHEQLVIDDVGDELNCIRCHQSVGHALR
jgi:cytochrome c nitrite reductase small subunit